MSANEDYGRFWNDALTSEPSQSERQMLDRFIEEYKVDSNHYAAALRCGYGSSVAGDYSAKFMGEPYVRRAITAWEMEMSDPEKASDFERRKILAGFHREANYHGPGSSHAARVAALAKIASLRDMDKPIKVQTDATTRGGIMMIPAIADVQAWQAAASASQEKLRKDSEVS